MEKRAKHRILSAISKSRGKSAISGRKGAKSWRKGQSIDTPMIVKVTCPLPGSRLAADVARPRPTTEGRPGTLGAKLWWARWHLELAKCLQYK